jgi:hypothetical protein
VTTFKIGDRVEYTGIQNSPYRGKKGTVISLLGSNQCKVAWENNEYDGCAPFFSNLKLLVETFKVGDRVEYVGNETPTWKGRKGLTGVISHVHPGNDWADVRDDAGKIWSPDIRNLKLVQSHSAVEEALKVLRAAGEVTFKPKRAPFKSITVKLNSSYQATVTDDSVTVGCQTFTFRKIDDLYNAVQEARAYNAEENGL